MGMTARWMCITALGAGLALGACDRGKAPSAEPAPEPTEAAEPTGAPEPAEAPAKVEARQNEAPEAPATPADHAAPADPAAPAPASDDPTGADKGGPADAGTATAGGAKGTKGAKGAKGKCGGVGGLRCKKSEKCRYGAGAFAPPHPDAMGTCVDQSYCDAPPDCEGLMHIMVVGKWACEKNRCAWKSDGGSGPM